ncbi:type II toxin-antitoxin system HipA family toxin [Rheinheimera salexigens]|uniref:HipA-like C-terminal domain-containing protein n=1 Tax=Rheinheimera salexigens TaxID=1628148 RepID=A0A1E7Q9T3_9GAMM|nr:HipA domain-containing protein [Rheinheimera salexigens]OEY70851.1 hypothetical protein BI198_15765 [Rheinheimera salexigens]
MKLTLQLFNDNQWHDAFDIVIESPELGKRSKVSLKPLLEYAKKYFDDKGSRSFTTETAVNLMDIKTYSSWPALFEDIMPMGYAQNQWLNMLNMQNSPTPEQDVALLRLGTIAPIGNMRIKESIEHALKDQVGQLVQMRFVKDKAIERDTDFLDYARQRGAVSGGATGAGGAAPKLLLRQNDLNEVWVDTEQNDNTTDRHYLVKFPRNQGQIDKDILRTEYHYYHELASLGFNTISSNGMELHEGIRNPSLWLPRFDREMVEGTVNRYGVESVYSLVNAASGSYLKHEDVLAKLTTVINTMTATELAAEYLKRDFLNIVFGNSDNHGRNTSVLKKDNKIYLAPIYDFAPMKADPESISRTINWSNQFQQGGNINWLALCDSLSAYGDPSYFKNELCELAVKLVDLPERLAKRGVPDGILNMPVMGFAYLRVTLEKWELLP